MANILKEDSLMIAIPRQTIAVDVAEKPVASKILRGGEEVAAPTLNLKKVDDFIDQLKPIGRLLVPRVVSQTVPPGTRVAKGTVIDLVLVPVSDINLGLLDTVHDDLKNKTVEQVLPLATDTQVEPILQKYETLADVPAESQAVLTQKLSAFGVGISTEAGKTLDLAFDALKSARAFK